jgi:hypothetical protein
MKSFDLIDCCTCDLFRISFNFHLWYLNSVWVGMVHNVWSDPKLNNLKDLCPVNIMARTTHTESALEIDSTWHSYETCHAECSRWIHCMWACSILLEQCCIHISCCLNDQNELILQLLQVSLVVTVPSTVDPISPCWLHATLHFAGWSDNSMTWHGFSEAQNLTFWLFTNPSRREWAGNLRWWGTAVQTVRGPERTHVSNA